MKKYLALSLVAMLFSCVNSNTEPSLKDALKDKFLIGVALNIGQVSGGDVEGTNLAKRQFNSIVAENCMKSEFLQPEEGKFFFDDADKFVEFGTQNKLAVIGHTLIWHQQAPVWFFTDENGNDVSRDVLIERMRNHIYTVAGRYKGKVKGWDVVNEAILNDGSWRETKFYQIIGEDFIKLAFQFAHEADPNAELYYNDYSMVHEAKRESVCRMVKKLQEQGVKIDGIGMQSHLMMHWPPIEDFEKSVLAFSELGVKVIVSELDLSVLPPPEAYAGSDISQNFDYQKEMNPYPDSLPAEVALAQQNRYLDFFKLFIKHSDKISRVTLWGVNDLQSWKNNWPIRGRTDYPLLFDRNCQAKPIVHEIIKAAKE